jgi:hypothetical protein
MKGELKRRLVTLMEEANFEYIGTAEKIIDEVEADLSQGQGHIAGYILISTEKWEKWFGV